MGATVRPMPLRQSGGGACGGAVLEAAAASGLADERLVLDVLVPAVVGPVGLPGHLRPAPPVLLVASLVRAIRVRAVRRAVGVASVGEVVERAQRRLDVVALAPGDP